ncbi:uncharacterized protein LOC144179249 [Haemaphysalis longicornis]
MYRIFMGALNFWLSGWAESKRLLTELQNGFRPGRRLDDNLFIRTQCAEIAIREQRSLMCCFLDVEKAYDTVPHAPFFQRLSRLGLPETLVRTVQRVYEGNTIRAHFGQTQSDQIPVTRGLRQGCPLSPLLYILYATSIERKLLHCGLGFRLRYSTTGADEQYRLPGLAFADDLVLMAECSQELQTLLDICFAEVTQLGLRFSAKKSAVLTFAGTSGDAAVTLGGEVISMCSSYKYLGVVLSAGASMYSHHEAKVRQSAVRGQCILRRRSLWGCNRFLMVRDLWKLVHVPALTFANAVVCLSMSTRQWLERQQRAVGRTAVGCHRYVANEAVQGDLGWSSFEAREAASKLSYRGRLQFMHRERWARRVFKYLAVTCIRTNWARRVYFLEKKYGFFREPVSVDTAAAWTRDTRRRVREEEEAMWQRAVREKPTLAVYAQHKTSIGGCQLYDNSLGSALLFEARAGALRTLVRQKTFDDQVASVVCRACGEGDESAEHLILSCAGVGRCDNIRESGPPPTLQEALGFGDADGVVDVRVVARTKRRLERWCETAAQGR